MVVSEVASRLGLEVLAVGNDCPVTGGYVADLLSDVIANAGEGRVWITVQQHLNIIAVAQLKKVAAILLPEAIHPEASVLDRATAEGIYVLRGRGDAFGLCGRLYGLMEERALNGADQKNYQ